MKADIKILRVVCCTEKKRNSFQTGNHITYTNRIVAEEVDVKDVSLSRIFFKTILKNDLLDRIYLIYRKEKNITV